MSWQLKYKPKTITESELGTIKEVTSSISKDNLPKSILISGEYGTGKTLLARILASYYTDRNTEDYMAGGDTSNLEGEIVDISDSYTPLSTKSIEKLSKSKIIVIDDINLILDNTLNKNINIIRSLESAPAIICVGNDKHNKYEVTIELKRKPEEVASIIKNILQRENVEYTEESLNILVNHCGTNIRKCINTAESIVNQYGSLEKQHVNKFIQEDKHE